MKTILVDVDLTVVNTGMAWAKWLISRDPDGTSIKHAALMRAITSGERITPVDYNLGTYFPKVQNPYDFWKQSNLYDGLTPYRSAYDALHKLNELGYRIVFCSHCFDGHYGSKRIFVDKHFPFNQGFIATKEKHLIRADYFVDDRLEFLMPHTHTKRILIKTPYDQGVYEELYQKVVEGGQEKENLCVMEKWSDIFTLL